MHLGVAIFPLGAGLDHASKLLGDEVQAVADAQHRWADRKHALVRRRSIRIVDGKRAPAQDDAHRMVFLYFFQRGRAGQHDGKNFQFADAARNKLRVLRAKVEDDNGLFFHE